MQDRDIQKLVKVLELTTSDVEGEALAAARMARKILQKNDLNYGMFVEDLQKNARKEASREIANLKNVVRQQSIELDRVKTKRSSSKLSDEHIFRPSGRFSGSIDHLRKFLLSNLKLKNYEREILEGITTISPKSKEEFLVLICARRHNVSHDIS